MRNVQALVRRSGIGVENRLKKIHIDCDVAFGDPNLRSAVIAL